jgi:glycosyltransferase involved in cell wall biosynthesis
MNKKIKVLVVPSDRTGVGYFRSTKPHITLENNYSDEFHIDIDYEPRINDDNFLKKYDIIHYHRSLGPFEGVEEVLKRCDDLGVVTMMDIDDYWSPGKHHPAHLLIKQSEMDKKILNNIKIARNVVTTTNLFAEEIKKYNKNVHVLPNAIDPKEKQYISKPEPSDKLRIGWLGGSSHLKDLELLGNFVNQLKSNGLIDKVQLVLCGFDLRGNVTMIDEKTGKRKQRPIQPHESVWYQYEKIFTDNYSTVSEDYKKHLLSFKQEEYEGVNNEAYRRVWTKPISTYATNYNLFDVSLAPLEEHIFNKVKSQLKVIEAGFHKKAIIAQDFGPYQIDLTGYYGRPEKGQHELPVNPEGNAILVKSNKNHKDWYRSIKRLVENPELVTELSNKLHDTVKDVYSVDAVTEKRKTLYINMLKENKNKISDVAKVAIT